MVLLQLVGSFEGYCAPQFEKYFAFARQDFAPQLLQNMAASEKLRELELRPFAFFLLTSVLLCTSVFIFFYLHFAFLFVFSFFCLRFFFNLRFLFVILRFLFFVCIFFFNLRFLFFVCVFFF